MANIHATITLHIKTDVIPPEIPGTIGPDGEQMEPISGAEQVAYNIFTRIQEVLPENVYGFVDGVILTD